jgi:hypothetical protein
MAPAGIDFNITDSIFYHDEGKSSEDIYYRFTLIVYAIYCNEGCKLHC